MSAAPDNSGVGSDQNKVVMYSTGFCGYCVRARSLLDRKGAKVTEIKVDENPEDRATMLKRSGGQRTVPQIFIGERHVGGYEELAALDRSGELDRLLSP
jgi:glutaredoxin 3